MRARASSVSCAYALLCNVPLIQTNFPRTRHPHPVSACRAAFDPAPGPITATGFNRTGNIFAYAVSYDWAKGHVGMTQGHINKIMLHACKDDEVKKRPKK